MSLIELLKAPLPEGLMIPIFICLIFFFYLSVKPKKGDGVED